MKTNELNSKYFSPNTRSYEILSNFYYKNYELFVNTSLNTFNDFTNQIYSNLADINFSKENNELELKIISSIKIQCWIQFEKILNEKKIGCRSEVKNDKDLFCKINAFKLSLKSNDKKLLNYLIDEKAESEIAGLLNLKPKKLNKNINAIHFKLFNYLQKTGRGLSPLKMNYVVEKYNKCLAEVNGHLSMGALAAYINLYNSLSEKEKNFIEHHLFECNECQSMMNEIFDEDFKVDDEFESAELRRQWPQNFAVQEFICAQNGFAVTTSSEKDNLYLFIKALPEIYSKRKLRLISNDGTIISRIISVETSQKFEIDKIFRQKLPEPMKIIVQLIKAETQKKGSFLKEKLNRDIRAAAAFIIIAACTIFYFSLFGRSFNRIYKMPSFVKETFHLRDTINIKSLLIHTQLNKEEAEEKKEIHNNAQAFFENAELENFIKRENQSSQKTILIQPYANEPVRNFPMKFIWSGKVGKTYTLEIFNNKNKKIYSTSINKTELNFNLKLKPGLYYWKLVSKSTITAISKFAVM